MSRHFLIDGYNLVKSTPVFAAKSLQEGRNALIRWLTVCRPQGSVNNTTLVVFDGRDDVFGGSLGNDDIKIVYTPNTSADDYIRDIVEHHPRPKDLVVVSNDKDITVYARHCGAAVISVEAFTSPLTSTVNKNSKPQGNKGQTKYISHTQADAINKELKKLWLNDD